MKKLFIVFFLLSILVACSNNNSTENTEEEKVLSYSGENEIWKAKIVAKKSDKENLYNYELSIEYKDDLNELKKITKFKYLYKIGHTEISRSERRENGLPTNKAIVYKDSEELNFNFNEQTIIPFKIEWEDKVEEFELKIN